MINNFKSWQRFAHQPCSSRIGLTALMVAMMAFPAIQVKAQDDSSHHQPLPERALSSHEQQLFDLLKSKGYSVLPEKVGYDYELKASDDVAAGEFIYHVSRDYYEQFTFQWTDSKGVTHTSKVTDKATSPEHILALLREVYTNPLIPGFRRDMYWDSSKEEIDDFKVKNDIDGRDGKPETKKDENGNVMKDDDGNEIIEYVANAHTVRSENVVVPYEPANFGLFRNSQSHLPVTKPFSGATALIVELKDNFYSGNDQGQTNAERLFGSYQKAYKNGELPPDRASEALGYIKSVSLMPLQFYVDAGSSENPGFLFNMNTTLSKCFIITKGVNRPYKAYTHRIYVTNEDGSYSTVAADGSAYNPNDPESVAFEYDAGSVFYNMFEEFSPTNDGPMYDAYGQMSTGHVFEVDHNCSSVVGQEHDIIFGPKNNLNQEYNINLMFFLPDKRFYGKTNSQDNDSRIYSCYTFYTPGYRPYFFFNRIYADIDQKIMVPSGEIWRTADGIERELDNTALVPLEWESLYKKIIRQNEEESFKIHRMVNGEIDPQPIGHDKIVIRTLEDDSEPGLTYVPADPTKGELRRKIGSRAAVYILEDNVPERAGEPVKYIVRGIRAGSGFEAVESNVVTDFLPNTSRGLTLRLTQAGSKYENRKNNYSNELQLVHTGYSETTEEVDGKINVVGTTDTDEPGNLKYSDILSGEMNMTKKGEDASGNPIYDYALPELRNATLELVRYDNKNAEKATVMTCDLQDPLQASIEARTWKNDYAAVVTLKFTPINQTGSYSINDSSHPVLENTMELAYNYSLYRSEKNGMIVGGNSSFRPLDKKGATLGRFIDNFAQSIETVYPTSYTYTLQIVPKNNGSQTRAAAQALDSNDVLVQVPERSYRVGYEGYTKEEIDGDKDTSYSDRLDVNRPGLAFSVSNNPYVSQYSFECTSHGNQLARIERYPGGVYRPFLKENDGSSERELARTAENFSGELSMLLDHWVDPGDELTLVLHFRDTEENVYTNGNTYGFPIMKMPSLPNARVRYFDAAYWSNNKNDNSSAKRYVAGIQFDTDHKYELEDFGFAGYGIWAKAKDNRGLEMDDYILSFHETSLPEANSEVTYYYNFEFGTTPLNVNDGRNIDVYSPSRMYSEILNPNIVIKPYSPLGSRTGSQTRAAAKTGYYVVTDIPEQWKTINGNNVATGIDGIDDDDNVEVEYYNLQGIKVSRTNMTPGVYIRKKGNTTDKILVN